MLSKSFWNLHKQIAAADPICQTRAPGFHWRIEFCFDVRSLLRLKSYAMISTRTEWWWFWWWFCYKPPNRKYCLRYLGNPYIHLSSVLSLYCLMECMMYIIWISWLTNPKFRRCWISFNLCVPIGRTLYNTLLCTGFVYAINVAFLPSSWWALLNLSVL